MHSLKYNKWLLTFNLWHLWSNVYKLGSRSEEITSEKKKIRMNLWFPPFLEKILEIRRSGIEKETAKVIDLFNNTLYRTIRRFRNRINNISITFGSKIHRAWLGLIRGEISKLILYQHFHSNRCLESLPYYSNFPKDTNSEDRIFINILHMILRLLRYRFLKLIYRHTLFRNQFRF